MKGGTTHLPGVTRDPVPSQPASSPEESLLELVHCSVVFGGLTAVQDVTFSISRGSLTGLIGPNGAGKTTIFNLITGVYRLTTGRIRFNGQTISGTATELPGNPFEAATDRITLSSARLKRAFARREGAAPDLMKSLSRREIARAGICRTFQNIRLFQNLSVLENVMVAANLRHRERLGAAMLRTSLYYATEHTAREEAMNLLATLHLEDQADRLARNLPYGAQRRLEVARALATGPSLLLLDEPAAGMNPQESAELIQMIQNIRSQFHLTLLLIEHDMKVVMGICERILVLENGCLIADGTPAQVRSNRRVIAAYLGEPDE